MIDKLKLLLLLVLFIICFKQTDIGLKVTGCMIASFLTAIRNDVDGKR